MIITLCPRVLSELQIGGDKRGALCRANYPLAGSTPASIGTRLLLVEVILALQLAQVKQLLQAIESMNEKASRLRVFRPFSFAKKGYQFTMTQQQTFSLAFFIIMIGIIISQFFSFGC